MNTHTIENKKIKIVATLGPATNSKEMIIALARAGANVFRLNLSHRSREESLQTVKNIRSAEKEIGCPLSVLGDLAGPKIRIGTVEKEGRVEPGHMITISSKPVVGTLQCVSVNFPSIVQNLEKGAEIYLGDGLIHLQVEKKIPDGVLAQVIVGGGLRSRMGFSAQGLVLNNFSLQAKDKEDIKTMIEAGADAIAVSFVQTAKDVETVRALLPKKNPPMVIAKIETRAAVENADAIFDVADAVMIARGDLGFSVPMAELPLIQKKLIRMALVKAKPIITATQMLESMIHNPLPTRAEVTDIANAILDGTDAVMLSGETAMGKFPCEAVKMMASVTRDVTPHIRHQEFREEGGITEAIAASVAKVADEANAKLIIVFTETGFTARKIARHRHHQPIIALSSNKEVIHKLNFLWGVFPQHSRTLKNLDELIKETKKVAAENGVVKLKKGEPFVISAGVPFGKAGATNLVFVNRV